MDCSPPGSSIHGILQARILEWVAISFSKCCIYIATEVEVSIATMENHEEVPPKFRITMLSSKLHTWVYTPKK